MREVRDHHGATVQDEARHWAVADGTVVVETRPPGSFADAVTTLTALDVVTGAVRWRRTCPPLGPNQAVVADGDLLVVLHVGQRLQACGYDGATGAALSTGEVRWRKKKAAGRGGVVLRGPDETVLRGTDGLTRVRSQDGKALWQKRRVVAATRTGEPARVVIARRADVPHAFAPDERIDVRVELLDARMGETVSGVDLVGVRRHWVDGDMSGRLLAVIDGVLVSGLEPGRVRAFTVATATADS